MNIELIDKNRLVVVLDDYDMKSLDITYEKFSWADSKSRNVISKLLTIAKYKTGFSTNNKKLSIETIPQFGGCVIFFTVPKKNNKRKIFKILKSSQPIIYGFDNIEDVLSFCENIFKCLHEIKSSILFKENNTYILITRPISLFSNHFKAIISEYGNKISYNKLFLYYLNESSNKLCDNNAISYISKILHNKHPPA